VLAKVDNRMRIKLEAWANAGPLVID